MRKIRHLLQNFLEYVLSYKKNIITNYIIFFSLITVLLAIDLLTKHFLFDHSILNGTNNVGETIYQNWLFGIRSVKNSGLTIFPNADDVVLVSLINFVILIACLVSLIFWKNPLLSIFISFIFSGSLGNTIDRLAYGAVRDIIFVPWLDRGTFNFADMDVVVGSIGFSITIIVLFAKPYFSKK